LALILVLFLTRPEKQPIFWHRMNSLKREESSMFNATRPRKASPDTMETYFHEINATPLLSRNEEIDLSYRVQKGDLKARDHLVRANLRLVVNIARKYLGRGAVLEDLVAEGNLGLFRAVEGFDPTMNTRFCTYATYWIKQSIRRYLIGTAKAIPLPAYMMDVLNKWRRATAELQKETGRTPTEEEVIDRMGFSRKKLKIIKKALRIHNMSMQHNQELDFSLDETLEDMNCTAPDEGMSASDEGRQVLRLVDRLEPRDATVIRLRFGLDGREPMTLKKIGDTFGLTRERVRQVERQALAKLAEFLESD
jgi:RNA polymerase primary sigma factor